MNSLLPLARRYRPHNFQSMVGQESTVRALTNALNTQRLHHAYLFTGTRGVGKTTLARILAKCLNCEQGISATPCEQCDACSSMMEGRFVDLIEVDAASKTKVEDTRELLDNLQYSPTRGRFKIYLIDEVHMLSGHSFNALLKSLEEPPSHVKFLLATTDPQKLPVTVLSRCLQFHLHPLPLEQIRTHLQFVLKQEAVFSEEPGLTLLSRAADGSLRDALSLLDQAIAYGQGRIEEETVRKMLGLAKSGELRTLLKCIALGKREEAFECLAGIKDMDQTSVVMDVLTILHQMAILKDAPGMLQDTILEKESMLDLAEAFSQDTIQLYYQIGLITRRDMIYAPTPQMSVEMMVLRMLSFRPMEILPIQSNLVQPNQVAQNNIDSPVIQNHNKNNMEKEIIKKEEPKKVEFKQEVEKTESTPTTNSMSWQDLIALLPLTGMVKLMADNCTIESWQSDVIQLVLSESQKPLLNKRNEERLSEALNQHFKKKIQVRIRVGHHKTETPAIQNQRLYNEQLTAARKSVEADPAVQKLVRNFEGQIEDISILPD